MFGQGCVAQWILLVHVGAFKPFITLSLSFLLTISFLHLLYIVLMSVSIITAALLLRIQLDEGIDSHNGNARLHCRLQLLDLAHAGFQNTSLERVVYLAISKIQAVVLVVLGLCKLLGVLR